MKDFELNKHVFLAKLITQYARVHQKAVGPVAEEYIRQIGIRTGEWIEGYYNEYSSPWTVEQYVDILIDLKNKIGGEFDIISIDGDRIVLKAIQCPFGDDISDAPHLCMMTSSVFGGIAARHFGYGKVSLRKRIALGDRNCEIAIYLSPDDSEEGIEYKDLAVSPANADPFNWEEETITMLNEELKRTDEMMIKLLDELEDLRRKVNKDGQAHKMENSEC
ncbi:methanogen output domain 1-containing protein [Fictibacillus fluitans]|uniref:Methanogen output domain 1-containing protein n=1 Tax=Fictibacillus fluitans TaxID=3058422 RepID=A0ABT8I3E5_9BACL|nr:methanogen output domain 1-containing protein [Fictibacillus sp. NE201]MDN4527565.1 methanogen output domain 1-containing protein [Fictibacillus sp. NE201]